MPRLEAFIASADSSCHRVVGPLARRARTSRCRAIRAGSVLIRSPIRGGGAPISSSNHDPAARCCTAPASYARALEQEVAESSITSPAVRRPGVKRAAVFGRPLAVLRTGPHIRPAQTPRRLCYKTIAIRSSALIRTHPAQPVGRPKPATPELTGIQGVSAAVSGGHAPSSGDDGADHALNARRMSPSCGSAPSGEPVRHVNRAVFTPSGAPASRAKAGPSAASRGDIVMEDGPLDALRDCGHRRSPPVRPRGRWPAGGTASCRAAIEVRSRQTG